MILGVTASDVGSETSGEDDSLLISVRYATRRGCEGWRGYRVDAAGYIQRVTAREMREEAESGKVSDLDARRLN